jgi:hypothetical protein
LRRGNSGSDEMKIQTQMLIFILATATNTFAWTIGDKGRVNGPSIHTTYFLTPNNQAFPIAAQAYMGTWVNGNCQPGTTLYNLGFENLQTGDFVDIDAFQLKAVMGGGYSCMTIFYNRQQPVNESFQLVWDGYNYITTLPAQTEIQLL